MYLNGKGRLKVLYTKASTNDIQIRKTESGLEEIETDVLLTSSHNLLIAEAKRLSHPVDLEVINQVEKEGSFYHDSYTKQLVIISETDIASNAKQIAQEKGIMFFGAKELSLD